MDQEQTVASTPRHDDDRMPEWLILGSSAVPMLPAAAMQVVQLAADQNSSMMQITEAVSKDQVLASRVLALANSVYSAPIQPITSLPDAVVRMGLSAVRNVVVTVCFSSRTSDPGVYGGRGRGLVDHSIGTAYMARLLAHEVDVDAEQAYLYGLMHDFGKLVILKLAADFGRRSGSPVPAQELDEALTRHHAGVGAFALRRWSLPDGLDEPVMCHHNYPAAQVAPREAMVAYLANRMSHRYGFGCDPEPYDMAADPAFGALGLTPAWLANADERAPGLYVVATSFLHAGGVRATA